ncbi:MAG: fructosamine kinase family protein [Roseivirga sp.]|nr:fructosamine kinase family protein [Roseivirga sp.]
MSQERAFFELALKEVLGNGISVEGVRMQGGGGINPADKISKASGDFFLQWNDSSLIDMFETKAKGLQRLKTSKTIRKPKA